MLMSDVAKKGAAPEEKRPSNPQGGKRAQKKGGKNRLVINTAYQPHYGNNL